MGLKMLHSADWHLDSPFASFSETQRQLLRREQQKIPGRISDLCRREQCDLVLLSGDLFDGNVSRDTLDILKAELRHCAVPVLIAPGNHDFCGPGSPWLEESWPENVYIFTGGLEAVSIPALDCRIYGAGYQSMDCPGLLADFRAEGPERYHIAVLHGDPTQKSTPYCPITTAQVKNSGLDYLALGHIHAADAFQAGDTLCAWPGCPMGRGWDETGEKGVFLVTLSDTISLQAVSLETICFHQLDVDVDEDPLAALEEILPAAGSLDFYRITLTGVGTVQIPTLLKALDGYPNLELRDGTEREEDLWSAADEDSLEGIYFSMLKKAMEADPENSRHIRMAAELSRRLLKGREVSL